MTAPPSRAEADAERRLDEAARYTAESVKQICRLANSIIEARDATIRDLRAELSELQRIFDLQWAADQHAIKQWQEAHPGNDMVWPDRCNMVVWLLDKIRDLRAEVERLRVDLQQVVCEHGSFIGPGLACVLCIGRDLLASHPVTPSPVGDSAGGGERPAFLGGVGQWECAGCGYMNHELRKRCRNCATPFDEPPPQPPRQKQAVTDDLAEEARRFDDNIDEFLDRAEEAIALMGRHPRQEPAVTAPAQSARDTSWSPDAPGDAPEGEPSECDGIAWDNLPPAPTAQSGIEQTALDAVFRAAGWHYTPDLNTLSPFERNVWAAAAKAVAAARSEGERRMWERAQIAALGDADPSSSEETGFGNGQVAAWKAIRALPIPEAK